MLPMSALLPLLNRYIFFFLFLFCCSSVGAFTFGASPPELFFEGEVGERICASLSLSSEQPLVIAFSDTWSDIHDSRSLYDYSLSASAVGLTPLYSRTLTLVSNATVPLCITAQRAGTHSGLLLLTPTQGTGTIGIWLHVHSKGKISSFITGFTIAPLKDTVSSLSVVSPVLIFLFTSTFLLLAFLVLLMLLFLRRRRNYTY